MVFSLIKEYKDFNMKSALIHQEQDNGAPGTELHKFIKSTNQTNKYDEMVSSLNLFKKNKTTNPSSSI